jgi:twitching motility protein PilT
MAKIELDVLLEELVLRDGSDLHLRYNEPPIIRVSGRLEKMEQPVLEDRDLEEIIYGLMTPAHKKQFDKAMEFDMAYEIAGVARFRVNCFKQMGHIGAVMRIIPLRIKTIDEWVVWFWLQDQPGVANRLPLPPS